MFFCHVKTAKRRCFYDDSLKVFSFLLWQCTQNPIFCVPSQLVSWSSQPLEPPSETYVSVHVINERKEVLNDGFGINDLIGKSFVQCATHSLR